VAKILSAVCVLLLLLTASPQKYPMVKYRAVEAYEVRPGISMFPSEERQVCQIGLERRHYSPETIRLDFSAGIPRWLVGVRWGTYPRDSER
jgi:hypothetical protein